MAWQDPLRRLLLSEHPSASPSLSPAISDTSLSFLEASIRLDKLKVESYGASKILHTFLDYLSHDGKVALAADIGVCQEDDLRLIELANHLLDAILKPFKLAGGHAPAPLTTPPSPGATEAIDIAMTTIEASTRVDQTNLRNQCLRRDGFRCVYSGIWDRWSIGQHLVAPPQGAPGGFCECAHIIPFALGSFDDSSAVQTRNKAIIWFALHRYFPELRGKIDARSINQPSNSFILNALTHRLFGEYDLSFLPEGVNQYRTNLFAEITPAISSKSGGPLVEFTSADNAVAMPEADFLKVHHIICQILQVSGFGRQIGMATEEALSDLDCHALHPNGSSDIGALLSRMMLMNVRVGAQDVKNQSHTTENP